MMFYYHHHPYSYNSVLICHERKTQCAMHPFVFVVPLSVFNHRKHIAGIYIKKKKKWWAPKLAFTTVHWYQEWGRWDRHQKHIFNALVIYIFYQWSIDPFYHYFIKHVRSSINYLHDHQSTNQLLIIYFEEIFIIHKRMKCMPWWCQWMICMKFVFVCCQFARCHIYATCT